SPEPGIRVTNAPERPSRRSFLAATAGLKSGVGCIGLSAKGCYQPPPGAAKPGGPRRARQLSLGAERLAGYANKPFDESRVCQGFATFQPCFGGFKVSRANAGIGAPCRPSLSSMTTAIS